MQNRNATHFPKKPQLYGIKESNFKMLILSHFDDSNFHICRY